MSAHPQDATTLAEFLYPLGIFAPLLLLIAVVLTGWLLFLFLRVRSLSEHMAYIAATLYPLLLGVLGSAFGLVRAARDIGNNGMAGIDSDWAQAHRLAQDVASLVLQLIGGSMVTCLFFPLGILALLIRKPK